MRLKIKRSNEQRLITLPDSATVSDLLTEIGSASISIKAGFPPQTIDIADTSKLLADSGIENGEMLIVTNIIETELPVTKHEYTHATHATVSNQNNAPYVQIDDIFLVLRKIPDDNSCFFNSIGYCIFGPDSVKYPDSQQELRQAVANVIRENNQGIFNSAILGGKSITEYSQWIQSSNSWGGAIEAQILAEYLGIGIWTVDIESLQVYKFNDDIASRFCVIMYSGIHYDAMALKLDTSLDEENSQICVFDKFSELGTLIEDNVLKLTNHLKNQGYYTNTSTFILQCQICLATLHGEKEANSHAKKTGHTNFGEVK
ncbi:BA75_01923T0 [Komagataella pastoris]|uniref:Ubiquitin thioesterase OTU n=1 Tax=Komagataella pastoris TaxID=4922 RepID=A0A1B2JDD0_PICPA|nr:BA75_01923T0 [Komagataella pastoris]